MSEPVADPGGPATAAAVAELRILVHRLADEVAAFRRRAIQSETRVRELEGELAALAAATPPRPEPLSPENAARLRAVEAENADLRRRLEEAAERTRQLLDRARFLRQQQGEGPP